MVGASLKRAQALRVGDGEAPGADMGPVVTAEAKARIEAFIAAGVEAGAELVLDGRGLTVPGMPASAPGMDMPGEPYDVLAFDAGGGARVWAKH